MESAVERGVVEPRSVRFFVCFAMKISSKLQAIWACEATGKLDSWCFHGVPC